MKKIIHKIPYFLKENWLKVGGLVVALVLVLGISNYLQGRNEIERMKQEQAQEQTKKEYSAKRVQDCYKLFEGERKQWSNTKGVEYDEDIDKCLLSYKATDEWDGVTCKDLLPSTSTDLGWEYRKSALRDYFDCIGGTFTKEF